MGSRASSSQRSHSPHIAHSCGAFASPTLGLNRILLSHTRSNSNICRRSPPRALSAPIAVAVPVIATWFAHETERPSSFAHRVTPQSIHGAPTSFLLSLVLSNALHFAGRSVQSPDFLLAHAPAAVALLLIAPPRVETFVQPQTATHGNAESTNHEHSITTASSTLHSSVKPASSSSDELRHVLRSFVVAALGAFVGAIVSALFLFRFGLIGRPHEAAQLAALFAATYIGGSLNYVAVTRAINPPPALASAGLTADLVVMALYFVVLFLIGHRVQRVSANQSHHPPSSVSAHRTELEPSAKQSDLPVARPNVAQPFLYAVTAFMFAIALEAVCHWLCMVIAAPSGCDVALLSIAAVGIAKCIQHTQANTSTSRARVLTAVLNRFTFGARRAADIALLFFFSALGSSTRLADAIRAGPAALCCCFGCIAIHSIVCLVGWLVCTRSTKSVSNSGGGQAALDARRWLVASNASVGGPTTAAAYAAGMKWTYLITPAIAVGTLGYALGTPIGVATHAMLLHILK